MLKEKKKLFDIIIKLSSIIIKSRFKFWSSKNQKFQDIFTENTKKYLRNLNKLISKNPTKHLFIFSRKIKVPKHFYELLAYTKSCKEKQISTHKPRQAYLEMIKLKNKQTKLDDKNIYI